MDISSKNYHFLYFFIKLENPPKFLPLDYFEFSFRCSEKKEQKVQWDLGNVWKHRFEITSELLEPQNGNSGWFSRMKNVQDLLDFQETFAETMPKPLDSSNFCILRMRTMGNMPRNDLLQLADNGCQRWIIELVGIYLMERHFHIEIATLTKS